MESFEDLVRKISQANPVKDEHLVCTCRFKPEGMFESRWRDDVPRWANALSGPIFWVGSFALQHGPDEPGKGFWWRVYMLTMRWESHWTWTPCFVCGRDARERLRDVTWTWEKF